MQGSYSKGEAMTTALSTRTHLCPGCAEKKIPLEQNLCRVCEELNPEFMELAEMVAPPPMEVVGQNRQTWWKVSGAIAFSLLVSFPFWARAVYEFLTGKMQ